jgi:hypothetical protein
MRLELTDSVKQLFLLGAIEQRFAQDLSGKNAALPALAGNAKSIANLFKRVRAVGYCRANLGVGYSFAETNVHGPNGSQSSVGIIVIIMRMIVNKVYGNFRPATVDRVGGSPYNAQPRN